jgi:hypothetical protein
MTDAAGTLCAGASQLPRNDIHVKGIAMLDRPIRTFATTGGPRKHRLMREASWIARVSSGIAAWEVFVI